MPQLGERNGTTSIETQQEEKGVSKMKPSPNGGKKMGRGPTLVMVAKEAKERQRKRRDNWELPRH